MGQKCARAFSDWIHFFVPIGSNSAGVPPYKRMGDECDFSFMHSGTPLIQFPEDHGFSGWGEGGHLASRFDFLHGLPPKIGQLLQKIAHQTED